MHGAGQRRIGVAVQRDMTEIDPAPVRQLAAGKAQRDHRPAIRIGGQLDALGDNGCRAIALVVVYRQRVPFSPIGRESTSKPLAIVIGSFISGQSG